MPTTALLGQGFLLGLSSGVSCLSSCAPVLLPVLLGGRETMGRCYGLMFQFLAARLAGYLAFAWLSWTLGQVFAPSMKGWPGVGVLVSLGFACLMLAYGIRRLRERETEAQGALADHAGCLVSPWNLRRRLAAWPDLLPAALGFLSGLSLCAPFLVALTQGALADSLGGSLLFFAAFFGGTALFFLPLPLVGLFRNRHQLRHVAGFAAILVGLFYLYSACLHGLALLSTT